ncbi:MAG: RNA polymerase sigma factor [Verrucomicrobiaceae bacterium]|nr:MAG: RNA polymerase sigma factor [Verrucomicrobiaceae bacterium]
MEKMDFSRATDAELLTEWTTRRSEPAFQALVARYAGLVHMAARRTCCGNDDLAKEVSQLVFILLAQKAKSLVSRSSLAGWLHVTAIMQAKNLHRKTQQETRKREQLLTTMDPDASLQANETWQEMQPVLDGALAALSEKDREALLLRFYRSLSIREVATTLGIDISAAQKRVDRATERLRDKLARHGCQAGGPLALALVTGFASDSQAAAVLVPYLTTKAVAAGAATTALSSTVIPLALMKASTYAPPVLALVLSALWLVSQNQSIASLEKSNEQLATLASRQQPRMTVTASTRAERLRVQSRAGSARRTFAAPGSGGLAWHDLADEITAARMSSTMSTFDMDRFNNIVEPHVKKMTREELVAALREVSALDAPLGTIDVLENFISMQLCHQFPEYALTQLADRLDSGHGNVVSLYMASAFEKWLKKDSAAATAWLDGQIAAGSFENRTLSGASQLRGSFEGNLIASLLGSDPAEAARRLEALPLKNRNIPFGQVRPEHQGAFADLVRNHLSKEDSLLTLSTQIYNFQGDAADTSAYLGNIRATPEELETCVPLGAHLQISNANLNHKPMDFPAMRAWVETYLPGSADRVTGMVLGEISADYQLGIAEATRLAIQQAEAGGGDAVLVAFLGTRAVSNYKEAARQLATRITDPAARQRVLEKLR